MAMKIGTFSGFQIRDLSFRYSQETCLSTIACNLEPGRFYGLIGPNGSGKSTLLDLLSGFLQPASGSIALNGTILSDFTRRDLSTLLASVPQSFSFNFDFSVADIVLMGRYPHVPRFSHPTDADQAIAQRSLQVMDVHHLQHRSIRHLSGGEKQRVILARALTQDTDYILLDEITASLDINHAISIMRILADLVHARGRTIIAAIHDLNMALAFCDHLIVLKEGRLEAIGPASEVLTEELILDLYEVQAELQAVNDAAPNIRFNYQCPC
jgi:iron complex transport system ATP-binding protein